MPGGHQRAGQNQVPAAMRESKNVAASCDRGNGTAVPAPPTANTNWKAVLATLGVKAAGQSEDVTSKEDSEARESIVDEGSDENAAASLASTNLPRAISPHGNAAAPSNRQEQSVARQSAVDASKSAVGIPNLIPFSKVPANDASASGANSTVKSFQYSQVADSGRVHHLTHSDNGKSLQDPSAHTAGLSLAMPVQWVPIPVVADPISKGFEATTTALRDTTGSGALPAHGGENAVDAPSNPTQVLLPQNGVAENAVVSRARANLPNRQDVPEHADGTSQSAIKTAPEGQEPSSSGSVESSNPLPTAQAEPGPGTAFHRSQVDDNGLRADSGTTAGSPDNKVKDLSRVPVGVNAMPSVPPNTNSVRAALGTATTSTTPASTQATIQTANRTTVGGPGGVAGKVVHTQSALSGQETGWQPPGFAGGSAENGSASSPISLPPIAASSGGTQAGEAFSALDADVAPGAATWIHAGGQRAEAGFNDPSLGWVSVRAEMGGGGIHAALVPGTVEAAQTLGGHIPGLSDYLAEKHTPVETLTLAMPGSRLGDAGMDGSPNQSMQQGTGHGAGPDQDAGSGSRQSSASVHRLSSETHGVGSTSGLIAAQAGSGATTAPHSSAGELHISVMA